MKETDNAVFPSTIIPGSMKGVQAYLDCPVQLGHFQKRLYLNTWNLFTILGQVGYY